MVQQSLTEGLRTCAQGGHFTGTQVSHEDAKDALAFAEVLLDQIHVLGRRFEDFKMRREAKAAAS
jgi:hypothetical protein